MLHCDVCETFEKIAPCCRCGDRAGVSERRQRLCSPAGYPLKTSGRLHTKGVIQCVPVQTNVSTQNRPIHLNALWSASRRVSGHLIASDAAMAVDVSADAASSTSSVKQAAALIAEVHD